MSRYPALRAVLPCRPRTRLPLRRGAQGGSASLAPAHRRDPLPRRGARERARLPAGASRRPSYRSSCGSCGCAGWSWPSARTGSPATGSRSRPCGIWSGAWSAADRRPREGHERFAQAVHRMGGLFAGGAALGRLDHALVGSREGSGRLDAPASRALNFAHGGSDMAPSARCDCLVHGDAEGVRQRLCRGILSHRSPARASRELRPAPGARAAREGCAPSAPSGREGGCPSAARPPRRSGRPRTWGLRRSRACRLPRGAVAC